MQAKAEECGHAGTKKPPAGGQTDGCRACGLYSNEYNCAMYQVDITEAFDAWLKSIKDSLTRKRLALRLRKAQLGHLGDVKPVGAGVWEMREHFGPGWRMYYIQRGQTLIVMLGGGDKSHQQADIAAAQALARALEENAP